MRVLREPGLCGDVECIRRLLEDEDGAVFRLDVAEGEFSKIAESQPEFFQTADAPHNREGWFAGTDANTAAERGSVPAANQCIGFSIPLVFAEGGVPYIADIYDHVRFLGDLPRQIAESPDGTQVRLTDKSIAADKRC